MDQNINRDQLLNLYSQQLTKIPGFKPDPISEAEEIEELDPLTLAQLKAAEKSPLSKDMVILSPSAQKFLEFLRVNFPIDPYIFLHNNFIKNVNFGKSVGVILDKTTKGYRMVFAMLLKK
jgi:hypothetical protein